MARTRTFIAVPLADEVRDELVALQRQLARTGVEVKWTEEENLHVTLVFLGEVNDEEIPQVCRIATKAVAGMAPFRMTVEDIGCFPNLRRPRVLWVGVGAGADEVCRIHDALETPLAELGYRREDRRYTPHITLGRIRGDWPTEKLTATFPKYAGWTAGEMMVSEVQVMGSELKREGPMYVVLGRAVLG